MSGGLRVSWVPGFIVIEHGPVEVTVRVTKNDIARFIGVLRELARAYKRAEKPRLRLDPYFLELAYELADATCKLAETPEEEFDCNYWKMLYCLWGAPCGEPPSVSLADVLAVLSGP